MTEDDNTTEKSAREEFEKQMEINDQNWESMTQRYFENNRPEWMRDNFVHTRSEDGTRLVLLPKPDADLPAIPAADRCEIVEQYAFQLSETPETIELELDTGERFVGEVEADHVEWERIDEKT